MAGGVSGNRLTIEIVAEVARLQQDLDRAKRLIKDASGDIARNTKVANDNLGGFGTGITKAGNQSKLASHHMANLSFQLQDMIIGLKSGQKPMTVFLQQGGQIAQIMGQAGIGVGGLAKAVGGMAARFAAAHPILLGVGAAASSGAVGLGLLTDKVNAEHQRELDAYAASLNLTAKEIEKAGGAAVTSGDMIGGLWDVIRQALGLQDIFASLKSWFVDTFTAAALNAKKNVSEIYAAFGAAVDGIRTVWGNIGPIVGDVTVRAANAAIDAIEGLINKAITGLNMLAVASNALFKTKFGFIDPVNLGSVANPFAGAGAAAADSFANAYQRRLGEAEGAFDRFMSDWGEAGVNRRNQRLLGAVEKEAEKAGKSAGKKAADNFGLSFAEAFKEFAEDFKAIEALQGDKAKAAETISDLQREAQMIGMVGWERERLLKILEGTAEITALQTRLHDAENAGLTNQANELRDLIALRQQQLRLELEVGNSQQAWDRANDAAQDYKDSLADIVGLLQQIGGIGGALGAVLGVLSGNTQAIRGPIGDLLNIAVDLDPVTKQVRRLGDVMQEALGSLGEKLSGALAAAGTGLMAGSAVFGKQGAFGQIGGAIGGAVGEKLGEKLLTGPLNSIFKGLGGAAGPIGSILGGIVLSGLTKLIGGADRGSAIISGGRITGTYGDTAKFKEQASQIAGGLLDTMQQIAGQFGTTLNTQAMGSLSIGIRDGKYAVDTLGRGYTKSSISGVKSFGTDAEAAVHYALKLMIERGAITMREGSLKIIKAATDLEEGLAKALKFEEIMNLLEGGGSQLVTQVKAVRASFSEYIAIMKEAGAATEDLARVQAMQADQIKAIIAAAGDSYRSQFYTDAQQVEFARQQIAAVLGPLGRADIDTVAEFMAEVEKAQSDTSDAGLKWLDTLYSLTDAFAVLKDAAAAEAAQREADAAARAAQREAERQERQRQIDAAKDALRQAWETQRTGLQQTIDARKALIDSLRDLKANLGDTAGAAESYSARLAELRRVGGLAAMGDAEAGQAFAGVAKAFLPAALANARTMLDYQRDVARVAKYADSAIGANEAMVSEAERQLAALDKQIGKLIDIDDSVISVEQAIRDLIKLTGGGSSGGSGSGWRPSLPDWFKPIDFGGSIFDRIFTPHRDDRARTSSADGSAALSAEIAGLRAEVRATALHSRKLVDIWEDAEAENGGFLVQSSA